MKSKIKQLSKSSLMKAFDVMGLHAEFTWKGADLPEVVHINKKALESYASENARVQLYNEGLSRANMEWSDNFLKQCRFYSMLQLVQHVLRKGLSADFIECGCWKGHSTYMIAKILREHGFSNSFHVFDSFEGGLSDKKAEDAKKNGSQSEEEIREEKELFASTEDELKNTIKGFDFIDIYKGWIPERFPEIQDHRFAFAHIDVDLYQPTRDSLEFIFPRLLPGGAVVVDDYGYSQFPGAKKAVDEFLERNDYHLFYEMPLGSCFIIKSL